MPSVGAKLRLVVPILGYLYYQDGKVPIVDSDMIKGGLNLGMVIGQVLLGVLSDVLGRHTIYGKELLLIIFGTLLVILLPWKFMAPRSITAWIAVFVLPAFITFCREITIRHSRHPSLDSLLENRSRKYGSQYCLFDPVEILRRIYRGQSKSFGMGVAFPPGYWHHASHFTLNARLTIAETLPYQQYVCDETTGQRRGIKKQWKDFRDYFGQWKHAKVLFATSMAWFSLGTFQASKWESLSQIESAASGSNSWPVSGRFHGCLHRLPVPPDSRSQCHHILIPVEVFPTRVRGTALEISAAAGKCGAILTSFAFGTVEDGIGLNGVLGLFSGVMLLTALVTLWIPESNNHTLEGIERGNLYGSKEVSDGTNMDSSITGSITDIHVDATAHGSADKIV
ncbi:hypothetical protein N7532_009520 [Penicillium argentinense]|uniref:Major facilitator superfamily (MFS) profile domain-containing protein n=1 Tax=Penicillium argentinense TaxID=1131581 RepID=A0A9W9EZM2_9EURO|nr:uncharacterized protein N7532_009520 [Penicillium argentinense]KAJ5090836.1 hypothetical protein N7532_009520 [Penicillium argentinense]